MSGIIEHASDGSVVKALSAQARDLEFRFFIAHTNGGWV